MTLRRKRSTRSVDRLGAVQARFVLPLTERALWRAAAPDSVHVRGRAIGGRRWAPACARIVTRGAQAALLVQNFGADARWRLGDRPSIPSLTLS